MLGRLFAMKIQESHGYFRLSSGSIFSLAAKDDITN
jgi:hypothetical protein